MNKQWKWQRAMVRLRNRPSSNLYGKEIWVEVGEPKRIIIITAAGETGFIIGNSTNLGSWEEGEVRMCLGYKEMEWLARGPEDFADDVPIIPYSEWSQWK